MAAPAGLPTLRPRPSRSPRDLLRMPVVGRFLRWRHARTVLQSILFGLAALIVLDGFFGPSLAPRNLAGVLPWVHWRGFVVVGLLVAGNLFCMACPFMLTRRIAKRILPGDRVWPHALRSKWLAIGLLVLFFWAYESFALWSSPWLTAWIILTYFAAAFVVDGFFRGATFCKYVCPIGQFHFVNSMLSPLEVKVRDPGICASCRTKDCIRGRRAPASAARVSPASPASPASAASAARDPSRPSSHGSSTRSAATPPAGVPAFAGPAGKLLQGGCELWLFQERKVGNMDCTFCMECIHACPHDNVGILARRPGEELWADPSRSGVGRLSRRPDVAALALLLTFGAFLNAFGMVRPVQSLFAWMAAGLGLRSGPVLTGGFFLVGLVILPLGLVLASAALSRGLSGSRDSLARIATTFAYALVPVGFGMWIAHYLHHLLLGGMAAVPLIQSYLADLGFGILGPPRWQLAAVIPEALLFPMQLFFLEMGMLISLGVAWRIAQREHGSSMQAKRAALPWGAVAVLLSGIGIWLLLQPMEMRGTLMMGGP